MDEHEVHRELHPSAPVFPVAPVRTRRVVPRAALAVVVVGVLAFVGGIAVASNGPTQRERPAEAIVASPAIAASVRPMPSSTTPPAATSAVAPGSSRFAAGFEPATLIAGLPDGAGCSADTARIKEVPRTRRDGPRLTYQRSWLLYCPVPGERRQAFLLDVFERFVRAVPAETFGYSAAGTGTGDALFPYAEQPLAGTVAVTATAAGDGFAIAVVLEEWRTE